jgi:hypothetical protein
MQLSGLSTIVAKCLFEACWLVACMLLFLTPFLIVPELLYQASEYEMAFGYYVSMIASCLICAYWVVLSRRMQDQLGDYHRWLIGTSCTILLWMLDSRFLVFVMYAFAAMIVLHSAIILVLCVTRSPPK